MRLCYKDYFICALFFLLFSCNSTIYKPFSIDELPPKGVSIDAKQRLLLVTNKGGEDNNEHVVCAEPSPDVFAVAALSATLKGGDGKNSIGVGFANTEAATALGVRTQTIQLLRDGMFRACEAYMNGVVSKKEYKKIVSGYDEVLITLVAIEGLTQQIDSSRPTINSSVDTDGDKKTATSASSTSLLSSHRNIPSTEISKEVTDIVQSYYCFQLGLKEFFYPDHNKMNPRVTKKMCGE